MYKVGDIITNISFMGDPQEWRYSHRVMAVRRQAVGGCGLHIGHDCAFVTLLYYGENHLSESIYKRVCRKTPYSDGLGQPVVDE